MSLKGRAFALLPDRIKTQIDLARGDRFRYTFGGPMNGQDGRRDIVRELFCRYRFDFVVETGTYRAVTTEFLLNLSEADIYSVEASERFFRYATRIAKRLPQDYQRRLHLHHQDSRAFLTSLEVEGTGFFYLDAHWQKDLPVWDEIRIIEQKWPRGVILVDDFEVIDDPGYRFDDYGPGMELTPRNLPSGTWTGRTLYYPVIASDEESGGRRGCIVLLPEPAELATLRRWEANESPREKP